MIFDKPTTMTDALRHQLSKRVVALAPDVGSREIQEFIPAQIRERSFFSARTAYAGYLGEVNNMIERLVQPDVRLTPDGLIPTKSGESISPAQVRAKMKQMLAGLGYQPDPEKRGGLQDLSSDKRTNLIIDTQLKMSRGFGEWRQSQDSTVLDLWPASEMYRALSRNIRREWHVTWNTARSRLGSSTSATRALDPESGPFVAKKNDPIWSAISRFGNPYPPFDFNSGMRVRDVDRNRAIELGVIKKADKVHPAKDPMNRPWSVDLQETRSDITEALQEAFGEQALLEAGRLFILPDPQETLRELLYRAEKKESATGAFAFLSSPQRAQAKTVIGPDIAAGTTVEIDASHISHIKIKHGKKKGLEAQSQIPITDKDITGLPDITKRSKIRKPMLHELRDAEPMDVVMETPDGYIVGATYGKRENRFLVKTMYKREIK